MTKISHIGYPKTASTTLQYILHQHDEVKIAGKPNLQGKQPDEELLRCVLVGDDAEYSRMRRMYKEYLRDIHILSDEGIVFYPQTMRSVLWNETADYNRDVALSRVDDLLDKPDYLIILREQLSFIRSYYIESTKAVEHPASFRSYVDSVIENRHSSNSMVNLLKYDLLCHELLALTDPDKVNIVFYSELSTRFEDFITELCVLIGVDADKAIRLSRQIRLNEGRSQSIFIKRLGLSRVAAKRVHRFLRKIFGEKRFKKVSGLMDKGFLRYSPTQATLLREIFSESDREVTRLLGQEHVGQARVMVNPSRGGATCSRSVKPVWI